MIRDAEQRIEEAVTKIGPNAKRVLADIAERLVKGAKEHGDFDTPRDWGREAYEEDLDGFVYRTLKMMSKEKT